MRDMIIKLLEDNYKSLQDGISKDDVLSLEALVTELDPEYSNFITSKIPQHKFSMTKSNVNKNKALEIIKNHLDNETTRYNIESIGNPFVATSVENDTVRVINKNTNEKVEPSLDYLDLSYSKAMQDIINAEYGLGVAAGALEALSLLPSNVLLALEQYNWVERDEVTNDFTSKGNDVLLKTALEHDPKLVDLLVDATKETTEVRKLLVEKAVEESTNNVLYKVLAKVTKLDLHGEPTIEDICKITNLLRKDTRSIKRLDDIVAVLRSVEVRYISIDGIQILDYHIDKGKAIPNIDRIFDPDIPLSEFDPKDIIHEVASYIWFDKLDVNDLPGSNFSPMVHMLYLYGKYKKMQ